jgi:hypothetical protein
VAVAGAAAGLAFLDRYFFIWTLLTAAGSVSQSGSSYSGL